MNLIIVESPTKARTLGRFLGSDYQITATMGHIRDLPQKKFGVDIKNGFTPEYETVPGKQKTLAEIKKAAKSADRIYLATDPDREGEAIAWHVEQLLAANSKLKTQNSKFERIVFHEITESALKRALENPRGVDKDLVEAQTARRVLDRVVGYKLSPLLWRKVKSDLSAGRVQSVAVRLIVEREREIEAFKSEEYWEVFCEVKPGKEAKLENSKYAENQVSPRDSFIIKLLEVDEKKAEIQNKEQADGIVADLEKANYQVDSVEKKEVAKSPYAPFTTSTLAQAASRMFSWSAKKTMSVAQKLYEEGYITYHRTDSMHLAPEAVAKARSFIEKEYGKNYLPSKPRFYKTTSKVAQEAHEAIRPTDASVTSNKQQVTGLGRDMAKLYELIWKRFVSCQIEKSIYNETVINVQGSAVSTDTTSTTYSLQAKGQIMKFDGWKKVYGGIEKEEVQLPDVQPREPLDLVRVDPQQKFTQPPARYTEASLIKTLEKLGIGRPSTYAPTILTIQDRNYVEKDEGKFKPTPIGIATNDFLVENFPDIFDYQFTAHMEDGLDDIANGKTEWVPLIRKFWGPFSEKLKGVSQTAQRVKIELEETGGICPECKIGKEVIRIGRFGKFLSCSRFPDCKWKAKYVEKIGMKCPGCKVGDVIIKKTLKGRKFFGCSRYPECNWASWHKPQHSIKTEVVDKIAI